MMHTSELSQFRILSSWTVKQRRQFQSGVFHSPLELAATTTTQTVKESAALTGRESGQIYAKVIDCVTALILICKLHRLKCIKC